MVDPQTSGQCFFPTFSSNSWLRFAKVLTVQLPKAPPLPFWGHPVASQTLIPSCPVGRTAQHELESGTRKATIYELGGDFNPIEKYARQNGNLPPKGVKINNF